MRNVVFRTLAGILTALFVVAMIFAELPFRQRVGGAVLITIFGAFALLGNQAADVLMAAFFGAPSPPSDDPPA
jgi:hypothetical protein